VVSDFELLDL